MAAAPYTLTDDLIEVTAIAEAIALDRWGPVRDSDIDATTGEIQESAAGIEIGTRYEAWQIERLLILAADEGWLAQDRPGLWRITARGTADLNAHSFSRPVLLHA